MRKREQQQQQPAPHFYMDIFEPPPQWRTSVNNNNNTNIASQQQGYNAHSPTHRSPIHHQPSLSEIVFQEFNGPSDVQDAYPGVYQQDRLSQQHQLHQQRSQQFQQQLHIKQHQEHVQLKQQQQQLQLQLKSQQQQEREQQEHQQRSRANSIGSAHDFESAASSLHTISTSPNYLQYDDIEDDNESVDKSMFHNHHHHRHQADNISISASLFTAAEHLENDSEEDDEEEEEEHYDDDSSTENQRHGYLTTTATFQEQQESINAMMQKLDIQTSVEWQDYKPQYRVLNESYDSVKQEIYKEIYATMQKMQELDYAFNSVKATFHATMEKNYQDMSNQLISQCDTLKKEQTEYKNKMKTDETTRDYLPKSEKIRLNVGGSIFETSLSTLRRDTNSLLATMFSGRHLISAESDGSYFIDRDPSHFRLVLNYLRDLRIPPTILQDTKICQELLQEANYYCIEGLTKVLHQHIRNNL